MIRKLRLKNGETITETLVALLIACFAMLMLAGALVSASKVNEKTKTMDTEFKVENCVSSSSPSTAKVKFTCGSSSDEIDVNLYESKDNNHYKYYVIPEDED